MATLAHKIYKMISEYFFAPKLRQKIHTILRTCDTCQRTKYLTYKLNEHVQPILTEKPNEILSIDFFGPLPTSTGGVKYLLITVDVFSKNVVMYPIKKANTATVIRKIFGNYIENYGKPAAILSDHGTQFTSKKWEKN